MAKFSNLQAPVTNPAANQRLKDTQALRARQFVAQQPTAATGSAAGAALTQQTGQGMIANQAQQAGLAKQQAGQQLAKQGLQTQARQFGQQMEQSRGQMALDQALFSLGQDAANTESQLRIGFNDRVAQVGHMQDIDLLNWTLANAKDEQDFKDKIQSIEQAHAKKNQMIEHAYKVIMQDLRQKSAKASQNDKNKLLQELKDIELAWQKEEQRIKAEAANRKAMVGAVNMIIGAGIAGAVVVGTGGAAAPFAAPIMGATTAVTSATGLGEGVFDDLETIF